MNEFNIGIGARKAKKMGSLVTTEQDAVSNSETVAYSAPAENSKKMIELRNDLEQPTKSLHAESPASALISTTSSDQILSKDQIIALAQKHGLKFEGMKKEFVKHTYSVTLDSKNLFKKYCDVLGLNMQDAMDEALQDFFKKHSLEYKKVSEAKRK